LKVHAGQYVNALQVVCMRMTADGRLDPDDSYASDWIGTPGSGEPKTVGGTGERVVGIHGRRAAILDAIGLVLQRPEHGWAARNRHSNRSVGHDCLRRLSALCHLAW